MAIIFRLDLTGSFSLIPSNRNNKPLNTIPISAIQTNFAAPGQCMILNKAANSTITIANEEKMTLNFSSPDVRFPTKELIIKTAERTPAATPVMKMMCAPGQCWVLNIIPLISSMVATSALILIIFVIAGYELVNAIRITQDIHNYCAADEQMACLFFKKCSLFEWKMDGFYLPKDLLTKK